MTYFGCFLGSIVYFGLGSAQVFIGFHAFDSGRNAEFLFNDLGQGERIGDYCDQNLGGECVPLTGLYKHGLSIAAEGVYNLFVGFVMGIFGLGACLISFLVFIVEKDTIETTKKSKEAEK